MNEAEYLNPRYHKVKSKIACIIPLYIPAGRKKDYGHVVEDKFETLKKTLAAHAHFSPGVEYDLILVNNGSIQDVEYFEKAGYKVLTRVLNEGYGFGAWKYAWNVFGARYDFFLFTEDDQAPAKDRWLAEILMLFMSEKNIGAVGNIVEAHGHSPVSDEARELYGQTRESFYSFDGAYTFTSSSILRQVDSIGGLPVYPCQPLHKRSATVNELSFQQPILELGYKLKSFSDIGRMIIHGSELYTGDLKDRGPIAPIINHNAGRIVPEVAEAFEWYSAEV